MSNAFAPGSNGRGAAQRHLLAAVAALLAEAGANIIEVSHQRTFSDLPAKATLLQLVIETRDSAHLDEVMAKLGASGLSARCT